MKTIYVYHCFYYVKNDEYGHIYEYEHEIAFLIIKRMQKSIKKILNQIIADLVIILITLLK